MRNQHQQIVHIVHDVPLVGGRNLNPHILHLAYYGNDGLVLLVFREFVLQEKVGIAGLDGGGKWQAVVFNGANDHSGVRHSSHLEVLQVGWKILVVGKDQNQLLKEQLKLLKEQLQQLSLRHYVSTLLP